MLSDFIVNNTLIPGTILDRVVKFGASPIETMSIPQKSSQVNVSNDGAVDSLRYILFHEHFMKPWSSEYMLVKLLTRSF